MWGCLAWSATSIASKRIFKNLRQAAETQRRFLEGKTVGSLVDRFEGTCDGQVILEFNSDTLIRERLEN